MLPSTFFVDSESSFLGAASVFFRGVGALNMFVITFCEDCAGFTPTPNVFGFRFTFKRLLLFFSSMFLRARFSIVRAMLLFEKVVTKIDSFNVKLYFFWMKALVHKEPFSLLGKDKINS
jgi:hypothetical protein